ncbi:MAG: RNA polymerase sigma-70 factor [Tannerella sp.]|nr:RNA polymerase sigma-70 factor [Tannerella sp.]
MSANFRQTVDNMESMFLKYAPSMLFYARKFVDFQTAEDMVQDVFLNILTKKVEFEPDEAKIEKYLMSAVHNSCLNALKHQSVVQEHTTMLINELKMEELLSDEQPEEQWINRERMEELYAAIESLPEKSREVVKLSYLENKKSTEIAAMLNLSKKTVESHLYKGMKRLRAFYKQQ